MNQEKNLCKQISIEKSIENELENAIPFLSKDHAHILSMYYQEGKSIKEISLTMNCSLSSAYGRLNKAKFIIKEKLIPSALKEAYTILYPESEKPTNTSLFL